MSKGGAGMVDPVQKAVESVQTVSADDIARRLGEAARSAAKSGGAPVHLWNPAYCGDLDIRIARDGLWYYLGTPIGRPPLVKLFSSVLRRDDDDKYYLVTPVEKIGIRVDDVPFVAVDFRSEGDGKAQSLVFQTNVGDEVAAGPENPIRVKRNPDTGEPTPYVLVRGRLEARIDRKSFYRLVDIGAVEGEMFGLWSGGAFYPLATVDEITVDDV
ncbi:MAG: DUF1285 domain-containing protein [Pseudomonadota bacterium]